MTENFPNLVKEKVTQVQEAQRVPITRKPKRTTPRQTIIKMVNFKDKENLKGSKREKDGYLQGRSKKTVS